MLFKKEPSLKKMVRRLSNWETHKAARLYMEHAFDYGEVALIEEVLYGQRPMEDIGDKDSQIYKDFVKVYKICG